MKGALLLVVTAAAWAADGVPSPDEILARVLPRVRETTSHIPRYACLETVTREYYGAVAPVVRSCETVLASQGRLTPDMTLHHLSTDRLRLEVALTSHGEVQSWPGEARFGEGKIDDLIREGPISTGAFGAYLSAVFEQDVKAFRFVSRTLVDGRPRAQFAFDVPTEDSHYFVKVEKDWPATAYSGMFEADVETGEVLWLLLKTGILPPAVGSCRTTTRLDLGRTAIGSGEFLLTTRAKQEFIARDGGMAVNTVEFSACREYRGESSVTFGTEAAPAAAPGRGGKAAKPIRTEVPPGLQFALELLTPIDAATSAGGDAFTARLDSPLRDRAGPIAPRGARVEGRVLRVQTYHRPPIETIVVLRPETVEVRGVKIPVAAAQETRAASAQQRPLLPKKGTAIILPFRSETNAALFRFPGDRAIVRRGFISHWVTR
jgi:hypothetical protein